MPNPALSFVIPLYFSEQTIEPVVREIEAMSIEGGHEIVLVNDGSADGTHALCQRLIADSKIPITLVEHARNFGEHNAVMTGWRHARGDFIVNLDDDGQNPPTEAARLWQHAKANGLDVVYGHYLEKKHAAWRNAGSWFTTQVTDWALDKPRGFYLSSFRCVSAFAARQATAYSGPYPYVDGLLLQVTQRIGSIDVQHSERHQGTSRYTLRRLVRLWMSAWINFSVLPLRVATLLGLLVATIGIVSLVVVAWLWWNNRGPSYGWGWLMAGLLIFSGTQLLLLGIIGEYIGRLFLTANQRPQSIVRDVIRNR